VPSNVDYTWKNLSKYFGGRQACTIKIEDCRAYTALRREAGRADGTIHTELNHLRIVLNWAAKHQIIDKAPHIELPRTPPPNDRYLTREEVTRLLNYTTAPHIRLAIHLMLGTAARVTALLELTWDRVDFERRQIFLRNHENKNQRKGRAVAPINNTLLAALHEAKQGALTGHVIEWTGRPVKSIKKGIATAARNAGIEDVSPHVFRHTAAVWMAEAGVPMSEIAPHSIHSISTGSVKLRRTS